MLLQYTLGFGDMFVIPLAVVVLLSAGVAVAGGKLMDKYGKEKLFYPVAAAGVVGGLLVYFIKFVSGNVAATYVMFILGGTMIEGASLLMAGLFNATARDYTPEDKAGCFQGIRIVIFVTLPMIIASIVLPFIINGFGPVVTEYDVAPAAGYFAIPKIVDSYGQISTYKLGDHVYPFELFLFSAVAAAFVFIPTYFVHKENKKFRAEKLQELNADVTFKDGTAETADEKTAEIPNVETVQTAEKSTEAQDGKDKQ